MCVWYRNDAELLKEIVNLVLTRLDKPLVNSKELVGIDEKIADLESLISKKPQDTPEEVFNKLQSNYEGGCFLANEREQSKNHGIKSSKNLLFSELLGCDAKIDTPNSLPKDIVRRICQMKVLTVLDDVNDSEHVEKLLGSIDNFGPSSRIILTTRDEQVLRANKVNETYQLREFSSNKALELFNLHAFSQSDHQREYYELSEKMVHYAKGNPLVVKVWLTVFKEKKRVVWESELYKLKKRLPAKVYDVMKLSYDDLDHKEQQIFLDLACFFLRLFRKVNLDKSLLKDIESDNSVVVDF